MIKHHVVVVVDDGDDEVDDVQNKASDWGSIFTISCSDVYKDLQSTRHRDNL